ncbi:hypothetical protein GC197_13095 [bacterium]|nr:hypothetical protein [bacterium]
MNDTNPFASPTELEASRPTLATKAELEPPKLLSFGGIISCIYVGWFLFNDYRFLLSPDNSTGIWILLQLYVLSVWLGAGSGLLGTRLIVSAVIVSVVLLLWHDDQPKSQAVESAGLLLTGVALMTALLDFVISFFSPRVPKPRNLTYANLALMVLGSGVLLFLVKQIYFSPASFGGKGALGFGLAASTVLIPGAFGSISAIWLLMRKHALSSWTIRIMLAALILTIICGFAADSFRSGILAVKLFGFQFALIIVLWLADYFLRIWGLSLVPIPIPAEGHTVLATPEEDDLEDD